MPSQFKFPHGATPLDDLSDLIPKGVENLNDLNRVEAENIALAMRTYFQIEILNPTKWFRPKQLLRIHYEMFCHVWKWAGTFRKTLKSIGPKPYLVPLQLAELCAEVHSWSEEPVELTFLERGARIHHRLGLIHPFENGNGRFSRFVGDLYLKSWKCHYPTWPSNLHSKSQIRPLYIQSLKQADRGDFELLLRLMIKFGAKEPSPKHLQTSQFFKKQLDQHQIKALLEAKFRLKDLPAI